MDVKSKNISLVIQGLERFDEGTLSAAAVGLHRGLLGAVGIIQREFLSGPRPRRLDVRSTRLRNSITAKVETEGERVTGVVGTNVVYAARHEFGFSGTENVRAHTRVVRQLNEFAAEIDLRRVLRNRKKQFVGFRDSRKEAAAKQPRGLVLVQFVRAHKRKVNYKGRPFVRPGVLKAVPMILEEVRKEMAALEGGIGAE